jgi:4-hydroxy-3-methylbut-2-en-1-yl diphosphate synthase IspG/GcpE
MHRRITMKVLIQFAAFAILLAGTMVLAFLGKPAEMGLAIVAAAMALVFSDIERFKKIKGAGFEAELAEKVEAIVEKETEPLKSEDSEETSPLAAPIDTDTKAVMDALQHPEYTWRYLPGIVGDTKRPKSVVSKKLAWLVENGFARRSIGRHGPIWSLTEEGRTRNVIDDFEDLSKKP